MKTRYRAKKEKKVFRQPVFWVFLLLLALASGLFWFFALSDFFQIQNVLISGNQKLRVDEVQSVLEKSLTRKVFYFSTQSLLLIDVKSIQKSLQESFVLIDSLKLKRQLPRTLAIEIVERQALATWCQKDSCFDLDKNGVVFEAASETVLKPVVRTEETDKETPLGQRVIDAKRLAEIIEIQSQTRENSQVEIQEFSLLEKDQRLNAKTQEGWQVYFDLGADDLKWQLVRLNLALEKDLPLEKRANLKYIDLRFSKIYYK